MNSLWKVLAYYGSPASDMRRLRDIAHFDPERGMADFEIASAARRMGYGAHFGKADLARLEAALTEGIPAIVLVQRDVDWLLGRRPHWVVAFGLDYARRRILIDWGTERISVSPRLGQFIRMWERSGARAVLVSPGDADPTNQ